MSQIKGTKSLSTNLLAGNIPLKHSESLMGSDNGGGGKNSKSSNGTRKVSAGLSFEIDHDITKDIALDNFRASNMPMAKKQRTR